MPYITREQREKALKTKLKDLCTQELNAGQINYIISILLKQQFLNNRCYTKANDLVGAIECAKQEFIRRYVNPYEDEKIEQNGDI